MKTHHENLFEDYRAQLHALAVRGARKSQQRAFVKAANRFAELFGIADRLEVPQYSRAFLSKLRAEAAAEQIETQQRRSKESQRIASPFICMAGALT